MYIKVILQNIRRNLKNYTIYFVTLAIITGVFYSFNALQSQVALNQTSITKRVLYKTMNQYISVSSVLLAIIMAFLIVYTNQFLLRRRKKEIGIYLLLGMKKRRVSAIIVGEILIIGIIGLIVGTCIGFGISQVLSVICIKMFEVKVTGFKILISLTALKKTILYFGIIYVIVMLINISSISKLKLLDLLTASRKNEYFQEYSKKTYMGIFAVGILILSAVGYIGLYGDIYKLNLGWLLVAVIVGVMCIFFSVISIIIVAIKERPNSYLKQLNMFILRQLSSKMQSNFISMTVVTILLMGTICIISTGISVSLTMNANAQKATPYDMSIMAYRKGAEQPVDIYTYQKNEGMPLDKYLKDWIQMTLYESDFKYKDILLGKENQLWSADKKIPELGVPIMLLSDYNKALTLQGLEELSLEDDECLINCNYKGTKQLVQEFMDKVDTITIEDIPMKLKNKKCLNYIVLLTSVGNNDRGTIIVPDSMRRYLTAQADMLVGNYNAGVDTNEVLNSLIKMVENPDTNFRYITKEMMYDMYYGSRAVLTFVCCYVGIVFLFVCVTVLAVQQLCETADNIQRYGMLRKLGASSKVLNKALFKQLATYFLLPLVIGGSYSMIGIKKAITIIEDFINVSISVNMTFTIIVFLVIYSSYFIITYIACRRMISEG